MSVPYVRCTPVRLSMGGRRAAGVSLLEMLLVLALIAAIAMVAAMAMSGGMDGMKLRSAGKELAAELRYARTRAIATGQPQAFALDVNTRRWKGPNGRHGDLPEAVQVSFTGARQAQVRSDEGVVRFFEDGASTGGRIELRARSAVWRIDVGWITGEVRSGLLQGNGS